MVFICFFLKFGKSYLAEALFCICATIGKYRYGLQNISQGKAEEIAFDSNLIYFICHAHSPASFIGEALLTVDKIPPEGLLSKKENYTAQLIKNHHDQNDKIPPVKKDFFEILSHICQELKYFKVRKVIEKMKADYNFQEEGKI